MSDIAKPTFGEATEIVSSVEKRWSEGSLAADVEAVLALFSSDAIFLGGHPQMYVGHDELRQYLHRTPMTAARRITFRDRQLRVLAPNIIATASFVMFDLELQGKPVQMRWAITWTLRRDGNGWTIASHHASPREEK